MSQDDTRLEALLAEALKDAPPGGETGECPSAAELADFLGGGLDETAAQAVVRHALDCPRCRRVLAAAATAPDLAAEPAPEWIKAAAGLDGSGDPVSRWWRENTSDPEKLRRQPPSGLIQRLLAWLSPLRLAGAAAAVLVLVVSVQLVQHGLDEWGGRTRPESAPATKLEAPAKAKAPAPPSPARSDAPQAPAPAPRPAAPMTADSQAPAPVREHRLAAAPPAPRQDQASTAGNGLEQPAPTAAPAPADQELADRSGSPAREVLTKAAPPAAARRTKALAEAKAPLAVPQAAPAAPAAPPTPAAPAALAEVCAWGRGLDLARALPPAWQAREARLGQGLTEAGCVLALAEGPLRPEAVSLLAAQGWHPLPGPVLTPSAPAGDAGAGPSVAILARAKDPVPARRLAAWLEGPEGAAWLAGQGMVLAPPRRP